MKLKISYDIEFKITDEMLKVYTPTIDEDGKFKYQINEMDEIDCLEGTIDGLRNQENEQSYGAILWISGYWGKEHPEPAIITGELIDEE
jgi:hypothetical protein